MQKQYKYDVAISFAGEDRSYAEKLATELTSKNVRVFYDTYEQSSLWGKNLYLKLQKIYKEESLFCIVIISKNYINKLWTKHELEQAQARSFLSEKEYILPVRLDDTKVPGVNETTSYVDARDTSVGEIVNLIIKKIPLWSKKDSPFLYKSSFSETTLTYLDGKGRKILYEKKSEIVFLKNDITRIKEHVTCDGYASDFWVNYGQITEVMLEKNYYHTIVKLNKAGRKGDRLMKKFRCIMLDSFTNQSEYYVQETFIPCEINIVRLKIPVNMEVTQTNIYHLVGIYESKLDLEPEIKIDGNFIEVIWSIINPEIKDFYKVAWELKAL